jgi:hypothetical protein
VGELETERGLGRAKAARVAATLELGARLATEGRGPLPALRTPAESARYLLPRYGARPVETFGLLALDVRHRLKREAVISVGCLTSSLVHPREVFQEAVVARAAALVLFHNHPSGDPEPSAEDCRPHAPPRFRGHPDGHRDPGPHRARGGPLRQPEGTRTPVTRIAYFDCASGASGDMVLGALVDLGLPLDRLRAELAKLPLTGYRIAATKVTRAGIQATKVDVVVEDEIGRSGRPERQTDGHGDGDGHGHEHDHDHEHGDTTITITNTSTTIRTRRARIRIAGSARSCA